MEAGYHPLDKYHHNGHHHNFHKWNSANNNIKEQVEDDGKDSARLGTALSPGWSTQRCLWLIDYDNDYNLVHHHKDACDDGALDLFAFEWCLGMCLQDMCEADVSNLFEASVKQVNLVKVVRTSKITKQGLKLRFSRSLVKIMMF